MLRTLLIFYLILENFKNNEIYNISDDKPSSQEEIASYGSKLLKVESPEFLELDNFRRWNAERFL